MKKIKKALLLASLLLATSPGLAVQFEYSQNNFIYSILFKSFYNKSHTYSRTLLPKKENESYTYEGKCYSKVHSSPYNGSFKITHKGVRPLPTDTDESPLLDSLIKNNIYAAFDFTFGFADDDKRHQFQVIMEKDEQITTLEFADKVNGSIQLKWANDDEGTNYDYWIIRKEMPSRHITQEREAWTDDIRKLFSYVNPDYCYFIRSI